MVSNNRWRELLIKIYKWSFEKKINIETHYVEQVDTLSSTSPFILKKQSISVIKDRDRDKERKD